MRAVALNVNFCKIMKLVKLWISFNFIAIVMLYNFM